MRILSDLRLRDEGRSGGEGVGTFHIKGWWNSNPRLGISVPNHNYGLRVFLNLLFGELRTRGFKDPDFRGLLHHLEQD